GVDATAARKLGVPVVIVTLGARGAVLFVDGRAIDVPVEPVWNLADSVGAGDAFLALMASAGADGATPVQAVSFACDTTAALLRPRVAEAPRGSESPETGPARSHGGPASRRVLLFDFGGTLDADGIPWKARVFRLFREEGLVAGADVFDPAFYAADDALTGAVPPTLSFEATVNELCQGVARRLEPAVTNGTAGRGAARFLAECHGQWRANGPLLGRLAGRYRLGVVSNFYGNLARVCEDTGIARYFDVLVDSACVGHRKPEPAIFRHALDALGVGPEAALFVGDSLHRDMAGARGVGIPHIWLTPGASDRPPDDVCCPGDRAVRSLQELEGLVLS